jgi:hypothetical protein
MNLKTYLGSVLRADFFDVVSDGELKMHELWTRYQYWEELYRCCRRAISDADDLEVDRYVLGNVMGKAMEYLRADYHQNAPKPWLIVMKKLRAGGKLEWVAEARRKRDQRLDHYPESNTPSR